MDIKPLLRAYECKYGKTIWRSRVCTFFRFVSPRDHELSNCGLWIALSHHGHGIIPIADAVSNLRPIESATVPNSMCARSALCDSERISRPVETRSPGMSISWCDRQGDGHVYRVGNRGRMDGIFVIAYDRKAIIVGLFGWFLLPEG